MLFSPARPASPGHMVYAKNVGGALYLCAWLAGVFGDHIMLEYDMSVVFRTFLVLCFRGRVDYSC